MRVALVSMLVAVAAVVPGAAQATPVDLLTQANVRIDGAAGGDRSGFSVAGAGDVNGDGRDDVIIGAYLADNNGRPFSGSSYVIYGSASPTNIDLASLNSTQGFRIDGAASSNGSGYSVAGAGDVNGDGRDDVIIGAYPANNNGRQGSGSSYVIYGSASPNNIDLASLSSAQGFRIDGANAVDRSGWSVAGAGDVNGDGRDDVIIGAYLADNNGRPLSGSSYVIYGSASPNNIDLASLNSTQGFRIDGAASGDSIGHSVAGAGDVNGDGRDDVIIGAYLAGNNGRPVSGSSYVIYGSASPTNIDLASLNSTQGFRIDGANAGDRSGYSVAGAGDVNGDGRDDVIIGAYLAGNNGRPGSGSPYVIYGSASPNNIDLASLNSTQGFRIDGAASGDSSGVSVAGAGDVNGDGRDDVIIGAYQADNNGRPFSGSSYVIYGSASPTNIDLASLNSTQGLRIDGANANDWSGLSVASAGDVNGDGRDDVIIGASAASNNGRFLSGSSFVVQVDATPPQTTIDSGPSGPTNDSTPTFTFSSNEPGATFECRIDDGPYEACESGAPLGDLGDGTHTFSVRAVDGAGKPDGSPASVTFTVDTTAPQTTITGGPANGSATNDNTPTFVLASSEPGTTFQCKVDGGAYAPCSSGAPLNALSDGTHTIAVLAVDAAGNLDASPATRTFTVDTVPPTSTTISGGPADGSATNDSTPAFAFDSDDPGVTFQCKINGGDYEACESGAPLSELGDGTHTFSVRSVDAAGNADAEPAQRTFTVDTTAPQTAITGGAADGSATDDDTPAFTFSSNEPGATFECRIDDGPYEACESGAPIDELGDGTHTIAVRAVDAAGNLDASPATRTFTVDTVAPTSTTISGGPADGSATNDNTPTFAFASGEPGSTFECSVDNGAYAPCASGAPLGALGDGPHTLTVRAVDAAGNRDPSPATRTFTVDTDRPETTITGGPAEGAPAGNAPVFAFASDEPGSTFQCKVDAGAFQPCISGQPIGPLGLGAHALTVRAVDAAGNVDGSPTTRTFVTVPGVQNAAGTPIVTSTSFSGPVATFTLGGGDAAGITATIDWGDGITGAGTIGGPGADGRYTVNGAHTYVVDGRYTATIRIRDAAGQVVTVTSSVLVYAPTGNGSGTFAISDSMAAVDTPVAFWGSQWSSRNPLHSGADAPAFKGYAAAFSGGGGPACGATWTTGPGNSANPPDTIAQYIGVVVTSGVTKSGSTISGDVKRIVVVKTDPGYAGNPGHAGTGKVVAVACVS